MNTSGNQKIDGLNKEALVKALKRLKNSTKNFSSLIVRDPLDYLDFEVNLDSNLNSIVYEVNSSNYHPQRPYLHLSAKNKGINRPTVVFDVKDALVFRFCIEQIENELFSKTKQRNIRGGVKITSTNSPTGDDFYEKWFEDWMEHQKSLQESLENNKYLVTTDIASYFENINILVLKDLVMGDVTGKNGVLNLLFYFLENTRFRFDYEVNTFNGLPQEDIDCSRILAYYFLSSHDKAMAEFCKKYDTEFYRFVDDMSLTADSEIIGKWALKCMSESLRRLNLISSIEKTSIIKSSTAKLELFFDENDRLTEFENKLIVKLKNSDDINQLVKEIQKYYLKLVKEKKEVYKNWIKILKRFYTLLTYSGSNFFLGDLIEHLNKYPILFSGNKIGKYLLQNCNHSGFNKAIASLINYLYSQDNLYPAIESNLLEHLLLIESESLNKNTKSRIKKLGKDIFFSQNSYSSLSPYARALSCLLVFKFDRENINEIAEYYLKAKENDNILRKYIIFVTLTLDNILLREKVLTKARSEQNLSISRFINLVDNLKTYKDYKVVKDFLKRTKLVMAYKKGSGYKVEKEIAYVRLDVLKKLIKIYS